jgi:hypothetical protein
LGHGTKIFLRSERGSVCAQTVTKAGIPREDEKKNLRFLLLMRQETTPVKRRIGGLLSSLRAVALRTPRRSRGVAEEDAQRARLQQWRENVLPRWAAEQRKLRTAAAVRSLCLQGIPSAVRGAAWKAIIGNDHCQITEEDYAFLKRRSAAVKRQLAEVRAAAEALDAEQRAAHAAARAAESGAALGLGAEATPAAPRLPATTPATAPALPEAAARDDVTGRARLPSGGLELEPVDLDAKDMRFSSMNAIGVDLSRTFAELSFFHGDGPFAAPLLEMLEAYVCYRPDMGYVQGMSYLAAVRARSPSRGGVERAAARAARLPARPSALLRPRCSPTRARPRLSALASVPQMLLLYVETEFEAFVCLCNLLTRTIHFDFYRFDMASMDGHLRVFDGLFLKRLPKLHRHFEAHGVKSEMFLFNWLLTVFAKALPIDVAARMWDAFLLLGDCYMCVVCSPRRASRCRRTRSLAAPLPSPPPPSRPPSPSARRFPPAPRGTLTTTTSPPARAHHAGTKPASASCSSSAPASSPPSLRAS